MKASECTFAHFVRPSSCQFFCILSAVYCLVFCIARCMYVFSVLSCMSFFFLDFILSLFVSYELSMCVFCVCVCVRVRVRACV